MTCLPRTQVAPGAVFVPARRGQNDKVGKVDQTYASIESTCRDCRLKDSGCYAQTSFTGFTVRRLDAQACGMDATQVAEAEACAIDASYGGGPVPGTALRLHVSGDCSSPEGARALAGAVSRWRNRGGTDAWTYTHSWRRMKREDWGPISVLASLDDSRDAHAAMKRGYAPARVVDRFPNGDKAWFEHGIRWVPCPEQTRGVQCVDCKLCHRANALRDANTGIAFAAHGARRKRALQVLGGG
jgi:hypothetical protein